MIEIETKDQVLRLVLNRPDKANALTEEMLRDLTSAIRSYGKDTKVLVLSGRGAVFSAGADLEAVKAGLAVSPAWEELSQSIADHKGLSVAALNGTLAGGAFGMALACDLRLAVSGSKFFYPAIRLGVLPQPSDPGRLARLVGPARAKMILLAGRKIDAETALSWGLIDDLCAPDALDDLVNETCAPALAADPDRTPAIKALIGRAV